MRRAIELARKGTGFVNPNPLVGAVIVKDGKIIGEGWHKKYGDLHAERNALKNCSVSTNGADMFVTLEPCCHHGKNPPCTEAVIASGIKRIYVGSYDPNPLVAGRGVQILRDNGIEVIEGFLKDECDKLNDIFFHYISTQTPYVILKAAVTADGKIAACTGNSKWITNEKSRAHTHETRKRVSAILVGINTVINDDPMLNCRSKTPSDPARIICDSTLRIPINSNIVKTAKDIPTYIACVSEDTDIACVSEDTEKKNLLSKYGVHILTLPSDTGIINLAELMKILGEMNFDSVLIEGGASIHASALKSGIVNKVQWYIAPKIIGGDGKNAVSSLGITRAADAHRLRNPHITFFDDDILIEYEVK
ncbi:MAG: bifunctional diaminohydroxyphosphoribosylaminopyrimidine deaminase/5-amino-6-(5-phosphoribosylamino)uracil reductase RibD [Clostridia bacterium]|nr:bifunctional diaminohydroxyphosphoribosylaminopyrimidine deaminase/5-amino-6-(5-phosphoribosylamino)uracil reductase RibD [Clostridia bacterium]